MLGFLLVSYTHSEIFKADIKDEILSFPRKQIQLEIIMLSNLRQPQVNIAFILSFTVPRFELDTYHLINCMIYTYTYNIYIYI